MRWQLTLGDLHTCKHSLCKLLYEKTYFAEINKTDIVALCPMFDSDFRVDFCNTNCARLLGPKGDAKQLGRCVKTLNKFIEEVLSILVLFFFRRFLVVIY